VTAGEDWKVTMFMTAVLFPGSIFLVAFVLNFVAMAYQSLTAISFGSIVCHSSIVVSQPGYDASVALC